MQEVQALSTAKRYANEQNAPVNTEPLPTSNTELTDTTPQKAPAKITPTPVKTDTVDPVTTQAMEDAKNGVYRTPEYYDNLRK